MILLIRSKSTTSLESYLVTGIKDFLQKRKTSLIDVFVDDIIQLNNTSSIGSELDAVFIMAMIQKRGRNVRELLGLISRSLHSRTLIPPAAQIAPPARNDE